MLKTLTIKPHLIKPWRQNYFFKNCCKNWTRRVTSDWTRQYRDDWRKVV